MNRLRTSGTSIFKTIAIPSIKRKALNSWSAVQDTYFSTKDVFERHRVVFTVTTSIASVATAWVGYSMRYVHQARVDERLESIERVMKSSHHIQHDEMKKIVARGNVSTAACIATAGTTLLIGYAFGLRSGMWYANRKFRREQMKLLGQIKPRKWQIKLEQLKSMSQIKPQKWQFKFLRRPLARLRGPDAASKCPQPLQKIPSSLPVENNSNLING